MSSAKDENRPRVSRLAKVGGIMRNSPRRQRSSASAGRAQAASAISEEKGEGSSHHV